MDQQYDQLDDKIYLIQGAIKKFNISKPSAENLYNKIARTRDPQFYAMSMTENVASEIKFNGYQQMKDGNEYSDIKNTNWELIESEIKDYIPSLYLKHIFGKKSYMEFF